MMISLDDSLWSRSYAVWSQLAAEMLQMGGVGHQPTFRGQEAAHAERRSDDRNEGSAAPQQMLALA